MRCPLRCRVPGTTPAPGAWRESDFPHLFTDHESMGDLGYIGTGILTGRRKPPGRERPEADKILNQSISALRAAVEQAIAHLKDWKILATRYRGPQEQQAATKSNHNRSPSRRTRTA
ncbi:hypothetical protein K4749_39890 [Streptomyces sp. TRM72054]|nr:hypothetical protein [Streptomyces sp. TRM72054]